MREPHWISIIGLGEDGPDGLTVASRKALHLAEIVMGPPRHLALLGKVDARQIAWPVPFADGIDILKGLRGQRVAVLVSGDPFWFGAGTVLARHFARSEWKAYPALSTFSLAASVLGWAIDKTTCLGLHAAPFSRLRPHLQHNARIIATLRDGDSVSGLATYLCQVGFGASQLTALEALGGANERIIAFTADTVPDIAFTHPICIAINAKGAPALPLASGRADDWFANDGQITKRPVRALTLSALAPKRGERLLDIGGGSGSISIEWLLCDPTTRATVIEANPTRAQRIRDNAARLGVDRLQVIDGRAPDAIPFDTPPEAIFIGGGLSDDLLTLLADKMPKGTRLVANAVTLESEALLIQWQARLGGDLLRIELSNLGKIGPKRGWKAAYPLVQWSVTL